LTLRTIDPLVRTLPVATVGRYVVAPAEVPGPAPVLVGFHGYGQGADGLLADLALIPGAVRWHRVSVLGLHRFYNTKTQEVVASWMTRLDREQAMADNVAYVAAVVAAVRQELPSTGVLVFAGFSQGASMAWRAAAGCAPCHGVLALAGDVPPDVAQAGRRLPPALLGRGGDDTWYTQQKLEADLAALAPLAEAVETCVFAGGHEWTDAFRTAAGDFLARVHGA
jgi:predicted esterase